MRDLIVDKIGEALSYDLDALHIAFDEYPELYKVVELEDLHKLSDEELLFAYTAIVGFSG